MKEYVSKEKTKSDSFNFIVGIHKTKKFSELKYYQIKIYEFGEIYEVYKYELPVYAGYHKFRFSSRNCADEIGKKAYFTSKNLIRPEVFYEDLSLIDCFKKYNLDSDYLVFNNNFPSKENGSVLYFEFNKKKILK